MGPEAVSIRTERTFLTFRTAEVKENRKSCDFCDVNWRLPRNLMKLDLEFHSRLGTVNHMTCLVAQLNFFMSRGRLFASIENKLVSFDG